MGASICRFATFSLSKPLAPFLILVEHKEVTPIELRRRERTIASRESCRGPPRRGKILRFHFSSILVPFLSPLNQISVKPCREYPRPLSLLAVRKPSTSLKPPHFIIILVHTKELRNDSHKPYGPISGTPVDMMQTLSHM